MSDPVLLTVPLFRETLEPPAPARVRAFKRHLVQSLRDLRAAKRPERLVQQTVPEPVGFTAAVLQTGCVTCRGHCCKGGGDHAYIDQRTMARVRRDNPALSARAVIGLFLARLAQSGYRGSCVFHGEAGCTLGRALRAELCNAYYCNGLQEFLQRREIPERMRLSQHGMELSAARRFCHAIDLKVQRSQHDMRGAGSSVTKLLSVLALDFSDPYSDTGSVPGWLARDILPCTRLPRIDLRPSKRLDTI